jgi:glycosyltransferase involved in cell wall biosynthesis
MTPWLLVTGDFVKTGGMDRANYALARYLAEHGCETHLVGYRVSSDLASRPNVFVHRVLKIAGSYSLTEPLLGEIGRLWASKIARRGGKVIVNGGNCAWSDINWVHYVHAAFRREADNGALARLKLRLQGLLSRARERRAVRGARILITNSDRTKRNVMRGLRVPESRVQTVYYGVDADLFRPAEPGERAGIRSALGWPQNKPVLLFVGALGDRRKGFDALFEAHKHLCSFEPRWDPDLVVVGAGAELPVWKKRAAAEGLASRIRFLGFRGDVPEILRACDILVSPTRYEAYGLNVHEAICCGLPAIVSADAGVAERYPAELHDLLLPDSENVDDLVRRLLAWRANLDYWRERMLSFSQQLRSYTWDDMARDIVALAEDGALEPG